MSTSPDCVAGINSSLFLSHWYRQCKYIVTMAFNGQFKSLHILAGILSLDILYLGGKSPLLMRNIQVNFWDILPKTSKSSAFWDMGVNSNLKLLPLYSPDEAGESDSTSLQFTLAAVDNAKCVIDLLE